MTQSIRALAAVLVVCSLCSAQNQGLLVSNTQNTGYFDVANAVGLAPANITVEAWVTYDETTITPPPTYVWPTIVRKNLAAGGEEYLLRVDSANTANRNLRWAVRTPSGLVNCTWPFAPGALLGLTHVAATWDGTTSRIFINGAQVATATGTGALVDNGGALRVGEGDAATPEFWNGILDDVRIWSVARTASDIQSTMFNPLQVAPNLEAAWILDGDALDYSGNAHHGVLVPPAIFVPVTLPFPTFQLNTPACSLDIDGVSSSIYSAGIVERCPGQTVSINVSGTPNPWDVAVTVGSQAVPDTAAPISPWLVNINLSSPTLAFLFGLTFNPGNVLPTVSIPAATPTVELDAQAITLDGTQPLGVAVSSVICLRPSTGQFSASIPGPTADDTPLGPIDITAAPLNCAPVTFYGTSYSNIFVNPNGRVSFTAGDTDFSPTVPAFLADPPSLGVWTDWSPNVAGSITIGKDCAGLLTVRWDQVPYFGQGAVAPFSSFDVTFDSATQAWSLANLTAVSPSVSTTQNMLVGACPGNVAPGVGTDPGPQDFTVGAGLTPNASDAIYEIGLASSYGAPGGLLGGVGATYPVDSITFIPNGLGYLWTSL